MKDRIIKISKPIPKVPIQPPQEEPQPEITQTEEISLTEELQQPPTSRPHSTSSLAASLHKLWWLETIRYFTRN